MLVSDKTSVIQLFSAFLPLLVALLLEGHCLTQWFNLSFCGKEKLCLNFTFLHTFYSLRIAPVHLSSSLYIKQPGKAKSLPFSLYLLVPSYLHPYYLCSSSSSSREHKQHGFVLRKHTRCLSSLFECLFW